jgi:hypothetical protein
MIHLPPGCTVGYEIKFVVNALTADMIEWFLMQGGKSWATEDYDHRGRPITTMHVQFGKAKASYKMKDGTNNYLIRFAGTDASTASIFLLKYYDEILSNNMEETMARYEQEV